MHETFFRQSFALSFPSVIHLYAKIQSNQENQFPSREMLKHSKSPESYIRERGKTYFFFLLLKFRQEQRLLENDMQEILKSLIEAEIEPIFYNLQNQTSILLSDQESGKTFNLANLSPQPDPSMNTIAWNTFNVSVFSSLNNTQSFQIYSEDSSMQDQIAH